MLIAKTSPRDKARLFYIFLQVILIPNQLITDELIWKKPRALRVGRNIALRNSGLT
jgi:hypothetical protein